MPQLIIHLDKEGDEIVNSYSKEWNLSKHETILKMIADYKKEEEADGSSR